jgi:hypothetical protein
MARIFAEARRGSIGPITYQGGARGTMARARIVPRNPSSPGQQKARMVLATVAAQWRELTGEQREAWRRVVADIPGGSDGYHAFVQVNMTLEVCGMEGVAEPPVLPVFGVLSAAGLVVEARPTIRLVGLGASKAPEKFLVEAAPPTSAGQAERHARLRLLTVLGGYGTPAADVDLTGAYVARFRGPVVGQQVVVRVTGIKAGFRGVPMMYSQICVAGA